MENAYDDETLGPLFPDPDKYSLSQLKSFNRRLAQKCFWYTERRHALDSIRPNDSIVHREVLFDSLLSHIRFVISGRPNASKNLYLRLLQRFLTCLRLHNAVLNYDSWLGPLKPQNLPSATVTEHNFDFNPEDPISSQYFLDNPF